MKIKVKAYLYVWIRENGTLGDFHLSQYQMSGENWLSVHKDEEGKPRQLELTVEVPRSFLESWQHEALANIEREEQLARAELHRRLLEIGELKDKILALPNGTRVEESEGPY
jgi:hypothetical protein